MKIILLNIISVLVLVIVLLLVFSQGELICRRSSRVSADLKALAYILEVYKGKYYEYPSSEDGFLALSSKNLLKREPVDPWNSSYRYFLINKNKYKLYSIGENGLDENGSGDDIQYILFTTKNTPPRHFFFCE